MGELVAKLLELFTGGDRKVLLRLALLLVVVVVLGPILVNYFFGYVRLEQQVKTLKSVAEIDPTAFRDPRLKTAYDHIVESISNTAPATTTVATVHFSVTSFASIFRGSNLWKFLSGASIMALLLVVVFFAKFNGPGARIGAFILISMAGFLIGIIGALIPTFSPLVINLVGFPFLQLCLLVYISVVVSRASAKKQRQGAQPIENSGKQGPN